MHIRETTETNRNSLIL